MSEFPNSLIKTSLGQTQYKLLNRNSKNLIILIHGFIASMATFDNQIPYFLNSQQSVLAYNWYGHGDSVLYSGKVLSFSTLRQQLDELLENLKLNDRSITIVGHSQGGIFATQYVSNTKLNIKSLVLLAPGGVTFEWNDLFHPWHWLFRSLYYFGTNRMTQWYALNFSASIVQLCLAIDYTKSWSDQFQVAKLKGEERIQYLQQVGQMLDNLSLLKDESDTYKRAGQVANNNGIKIKLVLGANDSIVTKRAGLRLNSLLKQVLDENYALHLLEDGTHSLPMEFPKKCVDIILA